MAWWRWKLARETGWALEYIDGLSVGEWHRYWQIQDGEGKAHKAQREAQAAASKRSTPRGRRR